MIKILGSFLLIVSIYTMQVTGSEAPGGYEETGEPEEQAPAGQETTAPPPSEQGQESEPPSSATVSPEQPARGDAPSVPAISKEPAGGQAESGITIQTQKSVPAVLDALRSGDVGTISSSELADSIQSDPTGFTEAYSASIDAMTPENAEVFASSLETIDIPAEVLFDATIPTVSFSLAELANNDVEISKRDTLLRALNNLWTGTKIAELPTALLDSVKSLFSRLFNEVQIALRRIQDVASAPYRALQAYRDDVERAHLRFTYEEYFQGLGITSDNATPESIEQAYNKKIKNIQATAEEFTQVGKPFPADAQREIARAGVNRRQALRYLDALSALNARK